ncbi:MAG TPA: FAD-binding oxidoreductase [Phnomibacter sp.]|nr:FAD-binding oxidoreductase [Phnomibacter sp.]
MQTSVIIVGQGLCGTWLSYWLQQAGIPYIVVDEEKENTSTRVASGVINPVTGRRMTRTWLADTIIPFAVHAYASMHEHILHELSPAAYQQEIPLIRRCDIIDFFSSPDRRIDFEKKATQFAAHLEWPEDEHHFLHHFQYEMGYGIVAPSYQVDLQQMLEGWRKFLQQKDLLLSEQFDHSALQLTQQGVQYKDIQASQIVFADGVAAAASGYFQLLPFAPNKGEALIVEIDGLPASNIYKKGSTITPWKNGLFWVGSTYENQYTDILPTAAFRQEKEAWLRSFVKHDFKVIDHLASVRPATVERRPFAGWHPLHPQVGILNGTGTKGVTIAPYFGKQLADNIAQQTPMMPEADIKRFARVLSRG